MKNTIATKTSRSKGENDERPGKMPGGKELEIGSPRTAEELTETTGGGEQKIVTTPSKNCIWNHSVCKYVATWPVKHRRIQRLSQDRMSDLG